MARRKNSDAPTRSRKSITPTVAYARSKKSAPEGDAPADPADAAAEDAAADPAEAAAEPVATEPAATEVPEATPAEMPDPTPAEMPAEPEPSGTPDPTPEPEPAAPVEIPAPAAPAPSEAPSAVASDENVGPIYEPLPKPRDITYENPESDAPPPGPVPRGDSRSLRRMGESGEEFILIYRAMNAVISRMGRVGKRGTWKVVEYPTMGHASHAYAQECSRLVAQGFADFRG